MEETIDNIFAKIVLLLESKGIVKKDAEAAAAVMIEGSIKGYQHHGVDRLFQILEGLEKGTIDPKAPLLKKESTGAIEVWDGCMGLGYSPAVQAIDCAIEKAKKYGIGAVGVINTSHIGILSYYAEKASKENCIGIVMSTSSPAVVIKGGSEKTFGTNPLCYSIPAKPFPITADFSTSRVSRGTLLKYAQDNKSIPEDWAVDCDGNPTSDPLEALKGGLQTFDSGIKGSCLSLLISVLAGSLIGGTINPKVTGTRDMSQAPNKGDFFLAFDISSFTNSDKFENDMTDLIGVINSQNAEFRVPGSRSHKEHQKNTLIISDVLSQLLGFS